MERKIYMTDERLYGKKEKRISIAPKNEGIWLGFEALGHGQTVDKKTAEKIALRILELVQQP